MEKTDLFGLVIEGLHICIRSTCSLIVRCAILENLVSKLWKGAWDERQRAIQEAMNFGVGGYSMLMNASMVKRKVFIEILVVGSGCCDHI